MILAEDMFPGYTGRCFPIFVSPRGSEGDRLVVGALAIGNDNQIAAAPFLFDADVASNAPEGIADLRRVGTVLCTHILSHLRSGEDVDSWAPPIERAYLGECRNAIAPDVWGLVDLGLARFSSLHVALNRSRNKQTRPAGPESIEPGAHLSRKLQRLAVLRRPNMYQHFLRYVTLYTQSRPLRIDFLGHASAVYFSRHMVGTSIGGFIVSSKAKLFSLQELRSWAADDSRDLAGPIHLRYQLAIAPDESRSTASDRQQFNDAVAELVQSAQRLSLGVRVYDSEEDIFEELIESERVA
jgi:hypothetical protein